MIWYDLRSIGETLQVWLSLALQHNKEKRNSPKLKNKSQTEEGMDVSGQKESAHKNSQ